MMYAQGEAAAVLLAQRAADAKRVSEAQARHRTHKGALAELGRERDVHSRERDAERVRAEGALAAADAANALTRAAQADVARLKSGLVSQKVRIGPAGVLVSCVKGHIELHLSDCAHAGQLCGACHRIIPLLQADQCSLPGTWFNCH